MREEVEDLHNRYAAAAKLGDEARENKKMWLEEVILKFEQCQDLIRAYVEKEEPPKEKVPEQPEETDDQKESQKRMLALEHEQETSKLVHQRMMDDLKREYRQENNKTSKENLTLKKVFWLDKMIISRDSNRPLQSKATNKDHLPHTYQGLM